VKKKMMMKHNFCLGSRLYVLMSAFVLCLVYCETICVVAAPAATWGARKNMGANDISDCDHELAQIASAAIWGLNRSNPGAHPDPAELTVGGHFEHGRNAHGNDITGLYPTTATASHPAAGGSN
jgi:hypothetical protein